MSLEQSLSSKKVTLGPGGSSASHHQQPPQKSPTASSADSSPKSSPSRTTKLSLKGLGRSSTSAKSSRSPVRRQQTLFDGKEKDKKSTGLHELGEYIPGTSGPAYVDHSPFYEANATSSQKQSTANKIIHNWKSACTTKTKDFIKRWKTLPENHPDFDHLGRTSPLGCANSSSSLTDMVNPTPNQGGGGGSSGGGGGPSGKFSKKKGGGGGGGDHSAEVSSGFQAMSLGGGKGGGVSFATTNNGPVQDDGLNGANKSSTGWSVHVWATYVQRGIDDGTIPEDKPPNRDFLSDFQKVKFTHFFSHVLDMNKDDVISAEDFVALNQRIRHYIEWSSECIEFHILKEVHSGFLECFLNQPLDDTSGMYYCNAERETRQNVNIDEWLDVWGFLLNSARTLEALPLWLQYFPKILFQVINKSGSGTISREELRAFYTMFLGIDFRVVNETLDSIYSAMTDNGRNKISYTLFKLCFSNFLFGKYPHGPGQYVFGICSKDSLDCPFPIDYSALNTPKDDLEPYDPDKDKGQSNRRSVIVLK
ncbi:uncharacterized protein LOC110849171 isoform X1 [Folsomia candida]|uniref:uncharacterized protein LOC110849171 isoform X1 n=2 Tax=Folsomia candida TaxID=158441 RepID=UPI001604BCAB|nr:uncharacterized protein LOC110849171 isoform X1 [Folsomia candida]XP_035707022.1 uncharacterized protein LOC110849171 isoform X1 [Folsomia candida]XP_035707024.1 uncharacterized protein LOC110849171 isoform X1 [Folsomia candida]